MTKERKIVPINEAFDVVTQTLADNNTRLQALEEAISNAELQEMLKQLQVQFQSTPTTNTNEESL